MRAKLTLSETTDTRRGVTPEMFSSLARRMEAMIEAQIATVDANRALSPDSSSLAIALRISPMSPSISD